MSSNINGPAVPVVHCNPRRCRPGEPCKCIEEQKAGCGLHTKELIESCGNLSRGLGRSFDDMLGIISNSKAGDALRDEYLSAMEEKEYQRSIGVNDPEQSWPMQIRRRWLKELEKLKKGGATFAEAWATVQRTQPDLYDAYVETADTPESPQLFCT